MTYAAWRRRLEEEEWRYARLPRHQCAAAHPDRRVVLDAAQRLYGCLDCGRSHACWPLQDTCQCVVDANGTDLVCCFSGRVVDRATAVPGTHANELLARDAAVLLRGATPGAALGVTQALGMYGRGYRRAANAFDTRTPHRRQLLARADGADALRAAAHDVLAYDHYGGAGTAAAASNDAPGGGDDDRAPFWAAADHAPSSDDEGDEAAAADGAGRATNPDAWLASARALVDNADTRRDDAYLDAYLAPVAAALAPWRAAFGEPRAAGAAAAHRALPATREQLTGAAPQRPWCLPWAVLPDAAASPLPHQRALLARYDASVAALLDRMLALLAWARHQTAPPTVTAATDRADALCAHLLPTRLYAQYHDALDRPVLVWQPRVGACTRAGATSNKAPSTSGVQKAAAALKELPFSGRALVHLLWDARR